jgi:hypothetical protein
MADSRGGKRAGAGRPAGAKAKRHETRIAQAKERIAGKLPDLLDALFELAEGVTVQEVKDGQTVVYTRPPDFKAASYLVDRVMGKPVQAVEASGPGGDPIPIALTAALNKVYGNGSSGD